MLVAYTLEILPFNIRAKGFAIMVSSFCPMDLERKGIYSTAEHYCLSNTGFQPICQSLGIGCSGMEICESSQVKSRILNAH